MPRASISSAGATTPRRPRPIAACSPRSPAMPPRCSGWSARWCRSSGAPRSCPRCGRRSRPPASAPGATASRSGRGPPRTSPTACARSPSGGPRPRRATRRRTANGAPRRSARRDRGGARAAYLLGRSGSDGRTRSPPSWPSSRRPTATTPARSGNGCRPIRRLPGYRLTAVATLARRRPMRPELLRAARATTGLPARRLEAELRARWGDPPGGLEASSGAARTSRPRRSRRCAGCSISSGSQRAGRAAGPGPGAGGARRAQLRRAGAAAAAGRGAGLLRGGRSGGRSTDARPARRRPARAGRGRLRRRRRR